MRHRFTFIIGLLALGLGLAPALPASAAVFSPKSFTLENGLQVVVVENHRIPVVTHMVWYKTGSADEARGKSGIAHFLEHLMFRGTETLKPGEFSRIVNRNGGNDNAFTSWDYTAYFQSVAADRLALVMEMEADRMANLRLTDEVVLPERDVILEERRQVIDNNPNAVLGEQMRAAQYLHYPYRVPIIGWESEMRTLTTEDALAWYDRWYAPNNAIVVIAGDVTVDQVRPLAEKYYGKVARREIARRDRVEEPPQQAARRIERIDARVQQPSVSRQYLAPSHQWGETQHQYALEVLAEILSGGPTSRLYRKLVVEDAIAVSAGAYYSGDAIGPGSFGFAGSPRPGVEVEAVEAGIDAEIARLLADGVTEAEIADAKQRLKASAVFAVDSIRGPANILGRALTLGQSIEDVESWPERIDAVTEAEIEAAAKSVLVPEHSVTGILRPKPTS
ncbi:MAG: insulinase family protein [Alphaproteobacteria bacterium]|nr:insulinase family protein [Alphaproteobacteria bacterium]MBU0797305.1 insulinase family protein [Alphaproteobacteria bacterium]MBU0888907.1 insulinase family protein [Alphaproteobacteria bacterium]MBU1813927.1 insulinase family protein [Alphaproteobacteria bacterium]